MRSLSYEELNEMAQGLQTLVGEVLQEFRFSGRQAGFCFGGGPSSKLNWLWVDLTPTRPLLLHFERAPQRLEKIKKPIHLFIKANLIGLKLEAVEVNEENGRIIILKLSSDWRIEIRLFPHGQNILLQGPEKSLSLYKPKDIPEQSQAELVKASERPQAVRPPFENRKLEDIKKDWLGLQNKTPSKNKKPSENQELKKLEKAIRKVENDIEKKQLNLWRQTGDWLRVHQEMMVPEEFLKYVDVKVGLQENIENCFNKAKQQEKKLVRSKERLKELQRQLAQEKTSEPKKPVHPKNAPNLLKAAAISGRTLHLPNGRAAFLGANAKDNLKLLRKARAWDLWLHIKDEPSSHVIIRRNKAEKLTDKELREVGEWLIKESFGSKAKDRRGITYEIIVAECRYVSPIKGDKIGRVQYRNEKTLALKFS